MSDTKCDRKIAQLGARIVEIHGADLIKEMLGRDRTVEAEQMLGRYYGDPKSKFTKLVNAIAGEHVEHRTRLSAVRSAFQFIEQYGPNGIQVVAATQKPKFQAEFAEVAA